MPGINDNGENQFFERSLEVVAESHNSVESSVRSASTASEARRIWEITLRDLYSQLGRNEYDSWIKNLALIELSQGNAKIAAPSSYACRRLENDYEEIVSRALSGVVGQDLSVQFMVEGPAQQGHLFEEVNAGSNRAEYNGSSNNQRPMPVPGIKARGPYLHMEAGSKLGNGRQQPARVNGQHYGTTNGYNNRNTYNGKSKPASQLDSRAESLDYYRYPEETAEIDDPITGDLRPDSLEEQQRQSEYEAQASRYGLNARYVFDRYIVGSSNRMATAAGKSVAENPGNSYNPLFIYGGVGLGKTHLLHAVGHEALRLRPNLRVLYVSSEKFTNELINGIREQRMDDFRNRYRTFDMLMIDDIQFIAGKEQTQEEFFHTFNTLVEANKQVVISSDRPPKSMLTLDDRLRSRFEGGLICDVSLPDYEMRYAILDAKARVQPIPIPSSVLEFIAHKVPSNIRELEGALIRVVAFGFLNKMPITADLASQALNDSLMNSRKKLVTKERIVEAVANFFSIDVKDLQGKSRSADIVLPRQIAMYIIREQTEHSLVEVGQALGGRDHTTVMHGLDKIEQAIETNTQLRQQINTITQIVYNGESLK